MKAFGKKRNAERAIWMDVEDEFIRNNASSMTASEIRKAMSALDISPEPRTTEALRYHLTVLNVEPKKLVRFKWSIEQERFLMDNFPKMRASDISKELGIPYGTVHHKINNMKLDTRLKRVSDWRRSLSSLDSISFPLWEAGVRLEIIQENGLLAVFATRTLEEVEEDQERERQESDTLHEG